MYVSPTFARNCRRRGTVAVFIALCLTVLIGILAITLDGGLLLTESHHAQAVADAAAMAAATDLWVNSGINGGTDPSGTAAASALATASANGYTNDGVTSIVTVNIPPESGDNKGKAGFAEVIVQYNLRRGFSAIWGKGTLPVIARSVASGLPGSIGILILDPTISDSLEIDGNLHILNDGKIMVNSTDSAATQVANTATLICGGLNLTGNLDNDGSITYTGGGSVKTGVPPVSDPLINIPEPVPSGTNFGNVTCSGSYTLQPGIYTSITVNNGATVTLQPGIYYLGTKSNPGNGLKVGSGATLTGNGIMFYNQSGDKFDLKQSGPVDLTPPTTGPYKGISFFQPRDDTQEIHIESISNVKMSGTFYAHSGEFDFRPDGASTTFNMGNYICDQMEAGQGYSSSGKSNGQINLNPGTAAPSQRPMLVE
ncbi:MAG TPA: pilus assembly protein TadG-related protein [Gemmataceae bacterium]|nr:pilus assembly protein TadG-related protein [Gemmataceae bacterium]